MNHLSCIAQCSRCGGSIRMQTSPKGRPRAYCASRAEGLGCDFSGTFLDVYGRQLIEYLSCFHIPEYYQHRILEVHRKLQSAYDDVTNYNTIQIQLQSFTPAKDKVRVLKG